MDRAFITCASEKCAVLVAEGRLIPDPPIRNWAAGLCAKSCSASPPGTGPCGASGTTAIRSGSGWLVGGGWYGCRMPM